MRVMRVILPLVSINKWQNHHPRLSLTPRLRLSSFKTKVKQYLNRYCLTLVLHEKYWWPSWFQEGAHSKEEQGEQQKMIQQIQTYERDSEEEGILLLVDRRFLFTLRYLSAWLLLFIAYYEWRLALLDIIVNVKYIINVC